MCTTVHEFPYHKNFIKTKKWKNNPEVQYKRRFSVFTISFITKREKKKKKIWKLKKSFIKYFKLIVFQKNSNSLEFCEKCM